MENFIFKNCDYKDLLIELKEKGVKIDAVITDPPYGVSRKHQLGFSNMGRAGMDYGEWDYNFDQKEYVHPDVADFFKYKISQLRQLENITRDLQTQRVTVNGSRYMNVTQM